jgi:hypothetical protein
MQPIIINIKQDPLEPTNASAQRFVRGAFQLGTERFGGIDDGVQINVNGHKVR